jgi:hypothetical protein
MPPVLVGENSDGTLSWPGLLGGRRVWYRIWDLRDIPRAYLDPPTTRERR